jgi:hypothetical protein
LWESRSIRYCLVNPIFNILNNNLNNIKYNKISSFYLYLGYNNYIINKYLYFYNSKILKIYQNNFYVNSDHINLIDIFIPSSGMFEHETKVYINILGITKKQINILKNLNKNIFTNKFLLKNFKNFLIKHFCKNNKITNYVGLNIKPFYFVLKTAIKGFKKTKFSINFKQDLNENENKNFKKCFLF